jgi:hypothetical protein
VSAVASRLGVSNKVGSSEMTGQHQPEAALPVLL